MGAGDGWIGVDPVQPGLAYVRIAGQARELRWDGAGAHVDAASRHDFTGYAGAATADARAVWFCDGNVLYSLADGVATAAGTFATTPTTLVDAGAFIAAREATGLVASQVSYQLETLRKGDGSVTLVEPTSTTLQVFGAGGDTLVLAGTPELGPAFVLARDGGTGARTTVGVQAIGVVRAASAHVDQPAVPVALLWCEAGAAAGRCGAGAVTQEDLAGTDTLLGTLGAAGASMKGDRVAGLATALAGETYLAAPGGFGDGETDRRDAWQFMPAGAGSLTRVTRNLP
jgi:hypothetical protein